MKRSELEHIIRAAGAVAETDDLVVIGSQAILATAADAPEALLVSEEADVYVLNHPAKAELIDGTIGEMSPFHDQFGYYAHGVGFETAILPKGWEDRLVSIRNENTRGVNGACLHPVDIAISKLCAGREKDLRYVQILLQSNYVEYADLEESCKTLPENYRGQVSDLLRQIS